MWKKIRSRVLLGLLLIVMVGLVACKGKGKEAASEGEDIGYIAVETETVHRDTISRSKKFKGRVVANEEVIIMPKTPGIVQSIHVELGDWVSEGTVLFSLEQKDVSKLVEQAEESMRAAEKGIEQAQNGLEIARVNYDLTKERFDQALIELERSRELYEEGAISKAQLEQAELAASNNQLEVAKKQVQQGEISVRMAEGQLAQARVPYEQSLNSIDDTVIRAPMDGTISTLNVKKGQIASNAQAAATMVDVDRVYLQIDVTEDMVNRLEIGQQVEVEIPSAFEGTRTSVVRYISPTADVGNRLYSIKVYLDNEDKKIRPGMIGNLNLDLDKVESVIVVDRKAVMDEDGEKVVYVVQDGKSVKKPVIVGMENGDFIEIKEGLEENEEVIVKGQHYVDDGKNVKVIRGE